MSLHILDPGLATLLVDLGRPHWRSLGVPVGGAADRSSLALGNGLVGNPPDAPALEMTLLGARLRADAELGCVLFGADFRITSNRQRPSAGQTFTLTAGEEVHIGSARRGVRGYFCVRGGIDGPMILGSRSSLEPLSAGTTLYCTPGRVRRRWIRLRASWNREPLELHVIPGPQGDWFEREAFYRERFRVQESSNRMGIRLLGPPLASPERVMTSEPVCPGSVQVTPDQQCIVLGVDGQTIGGYPKIAQVVTADLDKLGQLRPGDQVRFTRISLEEAQLLRQQKEGELAEWLVRLRETCGPSGAESSVRGSSPATSTPAPLPAGP